MSKKQHYTDEFKKQIVMLHRGGKSITAIVNEYGMARSAVYRWIKGYDNSGSFKAKDNRTDEQKELIELRKQVKQLEMENDILKQAALIMAKR